MEIGDFWSPQLQNFATDRIETQVYEIHPGDHSTGPNMAKMGLRACGQYPVCHLIGSHLFYMYSKFIGHVRI